MQHRADDTMQTAPRTCDTFSVSPYQVRFSGRQATPALDKAQHLSALQRSRRAKRASFSSLQKSSFVSNKKARRVLACGLVLKGLRLPAEFG